MSLKNDLLPYLKFTPSERKGVFVLLIILIFITLLRIGVPFLKEMPRGVEITFDTVEVNDSKQNIYPEPKNTTYNRNRSKDYFADTSLRINPNLASISQFQKLGFSLFAANNILKYRERGGVIYNANDLSKMYGVDSIFLHKIHKQLIYPSQPDNLVRKTINQIYIEINQANADTLMHISCIGPVISKRIIKYRNQLGGFVSLSQLSEVYGIDSICFEKLATNLIVDTTLVQRIELNNADEYTINKHPYISKYQAKAIIKYRELMGNFVTISQLKEYQILTESEYNRIVKYLCLNSE